MSDSLPVELLERDGLLSAGRRVVDTARRGAGGVLVFEGAPGVGKTSVLEALAADADGFVVARARPVELERAFGLGVVRRLFAALLRGRDRRPLLSGPGAAAVRVLTDVADSSPLAGPAVFGGLLWVLASLAEIQPLLLVVDDAQWADEESLVWLTYLAGQLGELPAALLVAARAGAQSTGLSGLLAADGVAVERVPPLGADAVRTLTIRALGHDDTAASALAATGGNPFLLRELFRAWAEHGRDGARATTPRLRHLIEQRVARSGLHATAVAEAVAVLGGAEAAVPAVAAVADLGDDQVLDAAEALSREDVLHAAPALSFVHPLVQEAVYDSLDPVRRARSHRRAAAALHALGAGDDAVAAHLLLATPTADPWSVAALRAAARRDISRGAPEAAARLLRRALAEPPRAEERADVLHELGEAEARANEPQAEATLRAALAAASGRSWCEVALSLGRLVNRSGRGREALALIESARERAGAESPELALRLEAETFAAAQSEPGAVMGPPRVPTDDRPELAGDTPGERLLLACLTFEAARGDAPSDITVSLGRRALAGDRLVREVGTESLILYFAIASLNYVDRYAEALRHLDTALAEARRTGSTAGYALARAWRADVLRRTGALRDAVADALDALAIAADYDLALVAPLALFPLVLCQIDAGEPAEAEAALAAHGFAETIPQAGAFAGVCYARGQLRLALGRTDEALADMTAAGDAFRAAHVRTLAVVPWRSGAALALDAGGRHAEAAALIDEELTLARALGAPRPLGLALRAHALTGSPSDRIPTLEAAAECLRSADCKVELARVLTDLGMAHVRAGARPTGRSILREALDLADRCGARALAERARTELVVAGARPRRLRISGRDALTPAELRVAEMAAAGRTNREIAADLFLTPKTIETHLGRAYSKLSITSRRELAAALSERERSEQTSG